MSDTEIRDMDLDDDINKQDEATGGVSKEEMHLIETLRAIGITPRVGSTDMLKLAKAFGVDTDEETKPRIPQVKQEEIPTRGSGLYHFPKFPIFYGEDGKGEGGWASFKFEVLSVLAEDIYQEEQILTGIRRSVKGSAADKLRRIGYGSSVEQVLDKLEKSYGIIETVEGIMKQFYTCEQRDNETVESYASRLEDLFEKAVELKGLRMSDVQILKQVFHSGLRKDLKQMSTYQCDKLKTFDEFKQEVRRMEADVKGDQKDKIPCKPAVQKEDTEVTRLLKKLNERIDQLEKNQQKPTEQDNHGDDWRRSNRGWMNTRGYGRGRGQNTRGSYKPTRPTAGRNFVPTCFICNEKGHLQRNCPAILAHLVCTQCKEKGHTRRDCPN